jgi:hypothetical protein
MLTVLRRLCVVLVLGALSLGYAVHTVRAELEQSLFEASEGMLALPAAWFHGAPRDIQVNGAHVRVSSGRSELALPALLDHVEGVCNVHSGGLAELVTSASHAGRRAPPGVSSVLRAEHGNEGVVACLDLGSSRLSPEQMLAKLQRFAQALDLAELGGIRLVRARALSHGTFFVLAESQGAVAIANMFPTSGDAPGADPALVPRPPRSRRLLSAWQPQTEPAIAVYEVEQAPDELWASYLGTLHRQGWRSPAQDEQSAAQHATVLSRDGHAVLVAVTGRGATSQVLVMPTDAGPGSIAVR